MKLIKHSKPLSDNFDIIVKRFTFHIYYYKPQLLRNVYTCFYYKMSADNPIISRLFKTLFLIMGEFWRRYRFRFLCPIPSLSYLLLSRVHSVDGVSFQ